MITVFISHASEDKKNFTDELAAVLNSDPEFLVWYDQYVLHAGMSLREEIDKGLASCDFGVVVFSHAFFGKKWTNAELNGLFALERRNRRIIIPVWHGVSVEDVEKFSPMLADRVGISTDQGVEKVLEKLKGSITAAQRQREVSTSDAGEKALSDMMQLMTGWELNKKILGSEVGLKLALGLPKLRFAGLWS